MAKRSFGSISRLASKRYRARYTGPDARWHNAPNTFTTRLDAEAWLVDERRLLDANTWTSPTARRESQRLAEAHRVGNTFGAFARTWLAARHDLRPTTRASYTTAITRHLEPVFGATPLTEITTLAVREWFATYGDRTPTARAHAYQVLSAILSQAEDDELIRRNPCRIRAGGRTTVLREPEVLTLPELMALAQAMPPQHRALTLVCGLCGLRFGEAVALRRRDLDLDAGVLRVRQGAIRIKGALVAGPPKTAAAVRDVAMPALVVTAIRDHLTTTAPTTVARDDLIFPGRDGQFMAATTLYGGIARTERRGGNTYQKGAYGFFAAREAIGRPRLHWHDLRRTAATLGAQSGASVREMQHRLGHTTPAMALHYQAATADRDRIIADRLQEAVDRLTSGPSMAV